MYGRFIPISYNTSSKIIKQILSLAVFSAKCWKAVNRCGKKFTFASQKNLIYGRTGSDQAYKKIIWHMGNKESHLA